MVSTIDELRAYVAARRGTATMAQIAASLGVCARHLRRVLRGDRAVSEAVREVVARAMADLIPPVVEKAAPVDHTHERIRALEAQNQRLRDANSEHQRIIKANDRRAGLVLELCDYILPKITPLSNCPQVVRPPLGDRRDLPPREVVDGILPFSDPHADREITAEGTWGLERYGFNAFLARLYEWAKTPVAYATKHLAATYRFDTLWVWMLGDTVNGDIHNMKHRNSHGNSLLAAVKTGDALAHALTWMAPNFRKIVAVAVPGNHGRTTQRLEWEDPWDNLDYLTAAIVRARLTGTPFEERIQIETPRAWTAYVDVQGKLHSLNHGIGVRATWGIPWYGFERREGRVQQLAAMLGRQVDYFWYGHLHTPLTRPAGGGKAIHAGAFYLTDPYALNDLSSGREPEMPFVVHSARFGRQIEIPIMLRDREREEKMYRREWTPPFGEMQPLVGNNEGPVIGEMPVIVNNDA